VFECGVVEGLYNSRREGGVAREELKEGARDPVFTGNLRRHLFTFAFNAVSQRRRSA
jgi:hypothetical protein